MFEIFHPTHAMIRITEGYRVHVYLLQSINDYAVAS